MDAIRENVTVTSKTMEKNVKCRVESGIIVPDRMPDVLKVIQVDAVAAVKKKTIQNEKLYIEGTVYATVLYLPENPDDGIKSIKTSYGFDEVVDSQYITDDARCTVVSEIEYADIQLVNSRKLNIQTVVDLKIDVCTDKTVSFISGLDCEDAACKYERASFNSTKCSEVSDFLIKDSIELRGACPQICEILKCDMRIEDIETKCVTNKVVIKGNVAANVLYVSTAGTIELSDATLPFTDVIEMGCECEGDNITARCDIIESNVTPEFNADGEKRLIKFEMLISATVNAYCENSISYLSDCYYFGYKTAARKNSSSVIQTKFCPRVTKNIRECIAFDNKMPTPSSVYNVVISPCVTGIDVQKDTANINTKLEVSVLYLSEVSENPVCCVKKEIPVSYMHKLTEECKVYAMAECEHISYSINSVGELEIRAVIGYRIEETCEIPFEIIEDVEKGEKTEGSEIIILRANGSESLWDIGKKYCVSCDEIASVNGIEADSDIVCGQRLIIPCI